MTRSAKFFLAASPCVYLSGSNEFLLPAYEQYVSDSQAYEHELSRSEQGTETISQLYFRGRDGLTGIAAAGLLNLILQGAPRVPACGVGALGRKCGGRGIGRQPFKGFNDVFNLAKKATKGCGGKDDEESKNAQTRKADTAYFKSKVNMHGVLVLRSEDLSPGKLKGLAAFLQAHPEVDRLRLQGMDISMKELSVLGTSLAQMRHITFCENSIGLHNGTAEKLVGILLCCRVLESTSIIRNSLTDKQVCKLERLITAHPTLKQLSLCWNGIGDEGAISLAEVLKSVQTSIKERPTFRELDLSCNRIGQRGIDALLRVPTANAHGDPFKLSLTDNVGLREDSGSEID